jgi:hypothetical protein
MGLKYWGSSVGPVDSRSGRVVAAVRGARIAEGHLRSDIRRLAGVKPPTASL